MELINKATITSLEIAEIAGKEHYDVMKAIRKMEESWLNVYYDETNSRITENNDETHTINQGKISLVKKCETDKCDNGRFALTSYIDARGLARPMYELTKTQCLFVATKFDDKARAKLVLRWEQLERENVNRVNTADFDIPSNASQELCNKMAVVTWASNFLNLNDNSKLMLTRKVAEEVGMADALPAYTTSRGILKSMTQLLNEFGVNMNTKNVNKILYSKGILSRQSRVNHRGETVYFYNITKAGSKYGENQVTERQPHQTQPLWYVDKFSELLSIIE